jgi:hypothetical protein
VSAPQRPIVLTSLVESYTRLGAAWKAAIEDEACAAQAPHAEWRAVRPDGEVTAWQVVV